MARLLVLGGLSLMIGSLLLLGHLAALGAEDVRDNRRACAELLRQPDISNVHLAEWEAPSAAPVWAVIASGLLMIVLGLRVHSPSDESHHRKPHPTSDWSNRM